ncbi:hypothetical protein [Glycomyces artemisiae]|uniref:Uncharacterized protein n=1 Tax=Glycomyces artemisiae TaxID=1076443 RepID=A0A2T0UI65_9ACTN|nr:hypothetical protein [Glycomyces artemisiae]PRY57639.1 hypothetical protein B0I28_10659 [Glycomyces artemisiae]
MDEVNADGGLLLMYLLMGGGVLLLFAWGVLAVSALLGLTSFSVARLIRGKREEEPEDDGIDGLF